MKLGSLINDLKYYLEIQKEIDEIDPYRDHSRSKRFRVKIESIDGRRILIISSKRRSDSDKVAVFTQWR